MVLVAAPAGDGPISLSRCGDLQRLKQLGDDMLDTEVVLSTTQEALSRLVEGYTQHVLRLNAGSHSAVNEFNDDVYHRLMEHSRELEWLQQQTNGLRQKLLGTSQLVWDTKVLLFKGDTDISSRFLASSPWVVGMP